MESLALKGCLDCPGTGNAFPLAFFVPSSQMPFETTLQPLAQALSAEGWATYTFPLATLSTNEAERVAQIAEHLKTALGDNRIDSRRVSLIGIGDGADLIARHYYSLYPVQFPRAALLLSASVSALYLNNLTCPFLLIHGEKDAMLESLPYSQFKDAVHHHQYRYGDLTGLAWYEGLGHDLVDPARGKLSDEVVRRSVKWLEHACVEGLRPQEPEPKAAA